MPPRRRLNRRRPGRSARGLTLVELVVAIMVLSIGTIAAFRAFDQAQRGIGEQAARALAHQVALNRAAELKLSGMAAGRSLPSDVAMGPWRWTVEVREEATRVGLVQAEIVVATPGQPGARLASYVPAEARR